MFFFFNEDNGELNITPSNYTESTFEDIKHIDNEGNEFWYARELQEILEYSKWQNFESIIDKAKTACVNSGNIEKDHFTDISKMVASGVADIPKKE